MRFCKMCVQPDTRPGIRFTDDGLCLPCAVALQDQDNEIDWEARKRELQEIIAWGKAQSRSSYDCILGVSGGKDSTRLALFARDELGLKPLLVCCSYPPEQLTEIGADNLGNLISLGFDCITVSPDPKVWKMLMRQGFLNHGNWCKSTEMALHASLPTTAIAYEIPLVFLGENPALIYGDWAGSLDGNADNITEMHTLQGGELDSLRLPSIKQNSYYWYTFPTRSERDRCKLRMVFLGYYISDFSAWKNAEIALGCGLKIRDDDPAETGEVMHWDNLDEDFVIINQMLKYVKFGFGKITDQVIELIRQGKMSRAEAVDLINKYEGRCGKKYVQRFCNYINITEEQFWGVVELFRNHDIFEQGEDGEWRLKVRLE